jgi:hypothetical protein
MDRRTRDQLVARYKDGYRVVAAALQGATDAELDARPAADAWSARDIAHHLADSEMTSAVRLLAFEAARLATGELLDRLSEAQWAKAGTHPEHARYSVERWLEIYADHAHNHADQITRARASARP